MLKLQSCLPHSFLVFLLIAESTVAAQTTAEEARALIIAGDFDAAADLLDDCLTNQRGRSALADCAIQRAKIDFYRADYPAATIRLNRYTRDLSLSSAQAIQVEQVRGAIKLKLGDYSSAIAHFDVALKRVVEDADPDAEMKILNNIGVAYLYMEDYEAALETLLSLKTKFAGRMSPTTHASVLSNIGDAKLLLGQYDDALSFHRQALQLRENIGNPERLGLSHRSIAEIYLELDRLDDAMFHAQSAVDLETEHGLDAAKASSLITYAEIQLKQGDLDGALTSAENALELCQRLNLKGLAVGVRRHLAEIHETRGNLQEALVHSQAAFQDQVSLHNEATSVQLARAEADHKITTAQLEHAEEMRTAELELIRERVRLRFLIVAVVGVGVLAVGGYMFSVVMESKNYQLRTANKALELANQRTEALVAALPICDSCVDLWQSCDGSWAPLEDYVEQQKAKRPNNEICQICSCTLPNA